MKREDYLQEWKKLGPIVVTMTRKNGLCHHELGDTFFYENPYKKPRQLCNALLHVLDLYTWRLALGFPSWEPDDESVFRIHCPCETGTVWEMRKADREQYEQHLASVRSEGQSGQT